MENSRTQLIAGNWKMNTSRVGAIRLASQIIASSDASKTANCLVIVPSIHIADVEGLSKHSHVILGAQNAHWEESGAYTGELSIKMLKDYGVKYLLVGHSERREMFGDTDQNVAKKFLLAIKNDIKPILCIGETLEQRENGQTLEVLFAQCKAVVELAGIQSFANACVAYEPIWAIGTGKTATPEQAQETHKALRNWFAEQNQDIANNLQFLYGGSMNGTNAQELLSQPDIDGGLIGGASLKAEEFLKIYSLAG
ncbi:MAG: triose-phosphate isomerase [Gammaproteobacteria bacterium]|nr:MAG: triose-phosphate isomerase [Gammaproteobacteria bacterium]